METELKEHISTKKTPVIHIMTVVFLRLFQTQLYLQMVIIDAYVWSSLSFTILILKFLEFFSGIK